MPASSPQHSSNDWRLTDPHPEYVKDNTMGTLTVLEACQQSGTVKRVVLSSTAAIYGGGEMSEEQGGWREDAAFDGRSPYALTKFDAEFYALRLFSASDGGMTAVCLRYFNVFGERQDPHSAYAAAIPVFLQRALEGRPLCVFGDGQQTRDFVYVRDVANVACHVTRRLAELPRLESDVLHIQANIFAATSADTMSPGVYNVGYGKATTVRELAERIVRQTGSARFVGRVEWGGPLHPGYAHTVPQRR